MSERMKTVFTELLTTYSPYFEERAAADIVQRFLTAHGIGFYEDGSAAATGCDCGNIVVCGAGDARMSFCAHLDTIRIFEQPIRIREEGGLFRGEGVIGADDRCGLAIMLEALAQLQEGGGVPGDVHFVFTTCEEAGFLGAKEVDMRHLRHGMNYVLDSGGSAGYAVTKGVGEYTFTATARGKMSHTGGRAGKNAALLAAALACRWKTGALSDTAFVNVSGISADENPNTIPDRAVVRGQLLYEDPVEAQAILIDMRTAAQQLARETGCACDFEIIEDCRPFAIDESEPVIRHAESAARRIGLPFGTGHTGCGSDAHIFNQRGAQAIKLATGMAQVHSREEYADFGEMVRCVGFVRALIGQ